jgi:hypothetical protein
LVKAIAMRDRETLIAEGEYVSKNYKSKESWDRLVKSRIAGFIQSRLYQGSWNLDGYEQCFDLDYSNGSFCEKKLQSINVPINIFNATTFASEWLVKKLKHKKLKSL